MTYEEQVQRQQEMNEYVWKNENAVEQALLDHDKAFDQM